MSIWTYQDINKGKLAGSYNDMCHIGTCPFCHSDLTHLAGEKFFGNAAAQLGGDYKDYGKELRVCNVCGWWIITQLSGYIYGSYEGSISLRRCCGSLKELDLRDLSTPCDELSQYLVAKYDDRFQIHPKKYEDIVAGVFSDFGYSVRVTSYSGDKGIDIIVFDSPDNSMLGIQVKRYAGKIEATQIREFVGSLILSNFTKGIFVTTSSYRSGAKQTAQDAQELGLSVELWDSEAFYDKLSISRTKPYQSIEDPSNPFYQYWEDTDLIPVSFSTSF